MSNEKNHQGRGGSTVVKDGKVQHSGGGLNPSDRGYDEAVRKQPVKSTTLPGTLNRRPTHADLVQEAKPSASASSRAAIDASPPDPLFKPNTKGEK